MYKKILFGTCLTEYCDHIFNFVVNLAQENNASLWIYYGLEKQAGISEEEQRETIKKGEAQVAEAYVDRLKAKGFTKYQINVSEGDVVGEMTQLAKNAGIDVIVMGTSTKTPLAAGEDITGIALGEITAEAVLAAPCPVLIVPPSLIPGLAQG
ncbi:MAG: universal stress protein [Thermodesulfobacteriota bacterium]